MYIVSQNTGPFSFQHNFRKYCPIFTARLVCSADYAWQDVCPPVPLSVGVRPSVHHTPVLSLNGYT